MLGDRLVIVDDADHLSPEQVRWLTETAAATNTKLLLITTPDSRQPAHTLLVPELKDTAIKNGLHG